MKYLKRILSTLFLLYSSIVFTLFMLLVLPFILLAAWLLKDKAAADTIFTFLKIWGWAIIIFCGFRLTVKGREHIKKGQPYIFVSNHNSYLDSPVVVLGARSTTRPLGKIEMTKIPIFGIIYRKFVVLIDRSSAESRAAGVEELKRQLALGISILIFPEGTMNRTDKPLNNFYDGAFRIAIETQTPVIPMAIIHARKLMPRNHPLHIHPGMLKCIYASPVEVTGLGSEDIPALKGKVRTIMEQMIAEYEEGLLV